MKGYPKYLHYLVSKTVQEIDMIAEKLDDMDNA